MKPYTARGPGKHLQWTALHAIAPAAQARGAAIPELLRDARRACHASIDATEETDR